LVLQAQSLKAYRYEKAGDFVNQALTTNTNVLHFDGDLWGLVRTSI
jgi:hypothetical protein